MGNISLSKKSKGKPLKNSCFFIPINVSRKKNKQASVQEVKSYNISAQIEKFRKSDQDLVEQFTSSLIKAKKQAHINRESLFIVPEQTENKNTNNHFKKQSVLSENQRLKNHLKESAFERTLKFSVDYSKPINNNIKELNTKELLQKIRIAKKNVLKESLINRSQLNSNLLNESQLSQKLVKEMLILPKITNFNGRNLKVEKVRDTRLKQSGEFLKMDQALLVSLSSLNDSLSQKIQEDFYSTTGIKNGEILTKKTVQSDFSRFNKVTPKDFIIKRTLANQTGSNENIISNINDGNLESQQLRNCGISNLCDFIRFS